MSEWKQFEYSDLVPGMIGKVIAVVNPAGADSGQVIGTLQWYREVSQRIEIGLTGLDPIDVVGQRAGQAPRLFLHQPAAPGILRQRSPEESNAHQS